MFRIAALTLWLLLPTPVLAQAGDSIEGVIRRQIEAFLQDDFATAFTFASPGIQGMFGTPQNFGRMVRQGYPMVWRPSDLRFLGVEDRGGRRVQTVMIEDAAGTLHMLEYSMVQVDGAWRIAGVRILRAPEVGT